MRIAIDARKLHDFGIGTYVQNLVRHLARLDAETQIPARGSSTTVAIATSRAMRDGMIFRHGRNDLAPTATAHGPNVSDEAAIVATATSRGRV